MKLLHEVIPTFAKKLTVVMNVKDVASRQAELIKDVFSRYQGDSFVNFELLEIERIVKETTTSMPRLRVDEDDEETGGDNFEMDETVAVDLPEFRVVNRVEFSSRNSRVNITAELLEELEALQVDFKLN